MFLVISRIFEVNLQNLNGFRAAEAMKNLALPPPYHPHVRSNRDLANFHANVDVPWLEITGFIVFFCRLLGIFPHF